MSCVIVKFGGACFADQERLLQVAKRLERSKETQMAVVVSARQGVTDQLSGQVKNVGRLDSAAADLLLATGELQCAALLAAALEQRGRRAEVVLPWTVFRTDANFGDANIEKVDLRPLAACFERDSLPIVPGFIGATSSGALTTLGRGGSDYSAIALGVALKADWVELCKAEVDGVYDADPRTHRQAQRFASLTHAEALRLSLHGAKVLQYKAAALADQWRMPVLVRPAFGDGPGTTIGAATVLPAIRVPAAEAVFASAG